MATLTLQSPGIQVNEIDGALRPVIPTGTNVLVLGFASQGPSDAVIQVSDFNDFTTIYGKPTNAAERYFYYSVQQVFTANANVFVGRLPYGANMGVGFGDTYTALVYPVVGMTQATVNAFGLGADVTSITAMLTAQSLSAVDLQYFFGAPTQITLTSDQYNQIQTGQINWVDAANPLADFSNIANIGNAGMIVLNVARTTIDDRYKGYYIGIASTFDLNPATDYRSINFINTVNATTSGNEFDGNAYIQIPQNRLTFALSAANPGGVAGSISEAMESIPSFNVANTRFMDSIVVGVFKLANSPYAPNANVLSYNLVEGYLGSLDSTRRISNPNGGNPKSLFIQDVEADSPNISILVNPSISRASGTWVNGSTGNPSKQVVFLRTHETIVESTTATIIHKPLFGATFGATGPTWYNIINGLIDPVDALYPLGAYSANSNVLTKTIGAVPAKVNRLLSLVENVDTVPLDLTIEAGLGTVYVASRNASTLSAANYFDDTAFVNLGSDTQYTGFFQLSQSLSDAFALNIQADYESVQNTFINFAQNTRKDHMFISDPLRHIFVQGANTRVLDDPNNTFSINVYWPLVHLYENINTSYCATYPNWFRVYDAVSDSQFWAPPSAWLASVYTNTDTIYQPWFAPMAFVRGILQNVNDVAISPSQKQRDMLYKVAQNPIAHFPSEGFVVMGQKTLLGNPSAFDRVNIRRLFLFLEKATRNTVKYFIGEPNTVITRHRIINNLTPIFELAKATEGIQEYLIICDERNNTPDIIDNNELVIDIYVKPVHAAEFILVNFHAEPTSFNFSEITG